MTRREKHIEQKIQMLKKYLEEQENYGKKLEEDIIKLQNRQKVLENDENTLDKVWYIFIYLISLKELELQKCDVINYISLKCF